LYYAALFSCHNHYHAQARIKEILIDFRERKEAEMYILPYEVLYKFIEKIVQQYQAEIDDLNQFVHHNLLESIVDSATFAPQVPDAIRVEAENATGAMDVDVEDRIDLETLSPEEQGVWVRKWVDQYQSECPSPTPTILVRKTFLQFLQTHNREPIQAKNRTVWSVLKQISPSLSGVTLRYF
jgi:hypothetical protein